MRGLMLCVFALAMLTASADEDDQKEEQREEEGPLQCFRCDLGFWDACYTTKTNCNIGERCYTGRGKAGDVLDVKLLGCVKVKECELVTSVEIFSNTTIYVMTKHCCDTHLCNTGHTLPLNTLLSLALTTITIIHLSFPRQ